MDIETVQAKYAGLASVLSESSRRLWAAREGRAWGHGGIAVVERGTGISRSTIVRSLRELTAGETVLPGRIRRPGRGRKKSTAKDASAAADLGALAERTAAGTADSLLRWTAKSVRRLATELRPMGYAASHRLVADLMHQPGYSLQANCETVEGVQHPDRKAQFRYLAERVRRQLEKGEPAISVDSRKNELVGDFKNGGREWRPKGSPEAVRVHDFVIPKQGKAIPYGVYDLQRNEGWVSVGIDHDTASFAVHAIESWWQRMGQPAYPRATSLLITADGGGSNGSRTRLWKWELQGFADRHRLSVHVCHFPPMTSKWNKIEHRLFSHIALDWRGKPLTSVAVIVSLTAVTTTRAGLRVRLEIDQNTYPTGVIVIDHSKWPPSTYNNMPSTATGTTPYIRAMETNPRSVVL